MAYVTERKIDEVVEKLWAIYGSPFRGKDRGRFSLSRDQLRRALGVQKLHSSTVERLQFVALGRGLAVSDLDDIFPCVEIRVQRKYRRPPKALFEEIFGADSEMDGDDEFIDDDE